jgi:putative endonuclease
MNKLSVGKIGEDLAELYLRNKGYKIIERNFRKPWGELDIIAKDSKGVLAFIEVKAMRQFGNAAIRPEDNLTSSKLGKLQRTAELYANSNENLVDDNGWRIDLVAISLRPDASLKKLQDIVSHKTKSELKKNIFFRFFSRVSQKDGKKDILTNIEEYCDIKHLENL